MAKRKATKKPTPRKKKMATELPKAFLEHINKIEAKRARTVIQHIIKHGQITTEELKDLYGYNHPPRAARDVREQGVLLQTIKVRSSDGRSIGAYIFDVSYAISTSKSGGRKAISKAFKDELLSGPARHIVDDIGHQLHNHQQQHRNLTPQHKNPFRV